MKARIDLFRRACYTLAWRTCGKEKRRIAVLGVDMEEPAIR